jgi:outer membrane protein
MRTVPVRWLTALTVALVFWGSAAMAADGAKIGVVNLQKMLETSISGKAAQNALKTERDKLEADLKQKGNEIQEMEKRMQREAAVMSREAREDKEREHRIKVSDINALKKKYQGDLQDLERKLMSELQTQISALVDDIGKKEGYTLIISNIGVLYNQASTDLTDRLIQDLNARAGKKAGQ